MSRNLLGLTVGWLVRSVVPACATLTALAVAAGTAHAGISGQEPPASVPELGSGAALTALALLAGASLILTNRRSSK